MHEIFVNYRTGDGEDAAAMIDRELCGRFGKEHVFFANRSIPPGERFPQALTDAAADSSALLVVIGTRWLRDREAKGEAGHRTGEWTGREIVAALESGSLVIPVLVGKVTRLDRAALPENLGDLADLQYRRLNYRTAEGDLAGLGDSLSRLLPALGAVDSRSARPSDSDQDPGPADMRSATMQSEALRQEIRGGIGNLNGNLNGTFVNEPQAPVHTGAGTQYNAPHFDGDNKGLHYTAGNNASAVQQQFGGEPGAAGDKR